MITFPKIAVEMLRWFNKSGLLDLRRMRIHVYFGDVEDYARVRRALDDDLKPAITTVYRDTNTSTVITICGIDWHFFPPPQNNRS